MFRPFLHGFAVLFALAPAATAFAQDPGEDSVAAVPMIRPGEAIAAVPLMKPAQSSQSKSSTPNAEQFAKLEASYNQVYASWVAEITTLCQQEGFPGPYPEEPTKGFYSAFRTMADLGNIGARLWCLRNFQHDSTEGKYQRLCWQGEAFSLATALRNDVEGSAKLRRSLFSGQSIGGPKLVDKVMVYLQDTTDVDEIRRATLASRGATLLGPRGEDQELGIEIAEEVIATWPESDEAIRLGGMLNALATLKVGGTPANFTGNDVDGKEISLYDYRGRVVVIDFWGFW